MFDHVSIGVRDIARTKRFYDAALAPLGYHCLSAGDDYLGYGGTGVALWIHAATTQAPNERPGLHFCFTAPDAAGVDAFHVAALAAGGQDNGAPGIRAAYSADYYAAFAVDPDGYRLEAYCKQA